MRGGSCQPTPEETTRVLVVEDDPVAREMMRIVFGRAGYITTAVGSAGEAEKAAIESPPDVLILDWLLPDGTGLQVAGQVRASCPSTAVVFLSGFSCEELRAEACGLHPAVVLQKPVANQHLLQAVEEAIAAIRAH